MLSTFAIQTIPQYFNIIYLGISGILGILLSTPIYIKGGSTNMINKFYKKLSAAAMAVILTFLLSAATFADTFTLPPVPSIAPATIQENCWGLYPESSYIISTDSQNQSAIPSVTPLSQITVVHPGEALIIPVVKGSYADGSFSITEPTNLQYFTGGGVPSNWNVLQTGVNPETIEEVRWYQGTESSAQPTLFLMVKFAASLVSTQSLQINASFSIQDITTNINSNNVSLNTNFENISGNINTASINTVTSPMIMKLQPDYNGSPVSFSFGDGILLKDVTPSIGKDLYFCLDKTYDNSFANQYMQFDLKFYNFLGNLDIFPTPARLYLPTGRQESYVYEIVNGTPNFIQSEYDEENGQTSFLTNSLGYYVVSGTELNIK